MTAFWTANVIAADSSVSRIIPTKNTSANTEQTENVTTKNRGARAVSRMAPGVKSTEKNVNTISRSVNNRKNATHTTLDAGVNTVGRSARTEAASINNNPTLRRAGITLRASTAEVGGRATI